MAVTIYQPKDNGDLKLIAEVEDTDRADLALDAVLDAMPRLRGTEFNALIGSLEEGVMLTLTLDPDAVPEERPKRAITLSSNHAEVAVADEAEDDEPEEAPKPARRGRTQRKGTARGKPGPKPGSAGAKRGAAKRKAARSSGGSPFKRNAKGDD